MKAAGKRYIQYSSRKDVFRLWNIADIHKGNRGCAEGRLATDIAKIKRDPFALWIGVGDYADYITPSDRRFDPETLGETFKVRDLGRVGSILIAGVKRSFTPIKEKCVGLLFGNHEYYYMLGNDQQDLHGWLCTELGVDNLGYSCFVDLVFVRQPRLRGGPVMTMANPKGGGDRRVVRVFAHHGASGASTPGGKFTSLVRAMDWWNADITILAHVHDMTAHKAVHLQADRACRKIVEVLRVGLVAGTYLRTYAQDGTIYGERRMYKPSPLGATYTEITPMTGELRGSV